MTLIVGCDHGVQAVPEGVFSNGTLQQGQRAQFAALLQSHLESHPGIGVVCGEWGRAETTLAYGFSTRRGLSWVNVNTSFEDLKRMGIPSDYVDCHFTAAEKAAWNRKREEFMA